jgi:hypothetical protein
VRTLAVCPASRKSSQSRVAVNRCLPAVNVRRDIQIASAASWTSSRMGAGRDIPDGLAMGIAFARAYRRIVFRESPNSRTTSRIGTPSVSTLCRMTAIKSMGTIPGE